MKLKSFKYLFDLILVALVCIYFFNEFRFKDKPYENWTGIYNADVNGYYLYLPAIFIHNNMDLSYSESEAFRNEYKAFGHFDIYTGNLHENGRKFSKYYIGTALMQLPFFISALGYSHVSQYLSDGYSMPFQIATFIAALFYFLAGLYFIKRLLLRLGYTLLTAQITILAIALGTNVFNYVWYEPGMSHVYVFCCIAGFINVTHSFFQKANRKDFLLSAFFLGLICIIRPTSAIVVVSLPFLSGYLSRFKDALNFLLRNVMTVVLAIAIIFSFIFCQLLMYKLQVGHWWIWSYGNEGFNFLHPKFFELLIGFRNGLFIYSPLTVLFVVGSIVYFRKNKFGAGNLLLAFVLFNYVLSSWWNWWYGGSFGLRSFIDFYPLFSVPLAFLIQSLHRRYFAFILPVIIAGGISLNFIQNIQYRWSIIDYDLMTKEKYLQVFLELGDEFRFVTSNNHKCLFEDNYRLIKTYYYDFEGPAIWPFPDSVSLLSYDSNNSQIGHFCRVDSNRTYGPNVAFAIDSIPYSKILVFKYEADLYVHNKKSLASIVFDIKDNNHYWRNQRIINEVRTVNEWRHASFEFKTSDFFKKGDVLLLYLNNPKDLPVDIDNMRFSVYALDEE